MIITIESRDITSMRTSVNSRGKRLLKLESDQIEVWLTLDSSQIEQLVGMICNSEGIHDIEAQLRIGLESIARDTRTVGSDSGIPHVAEKAEMLLRLLQNAGRTV